MKWLLRSCARHLCLLGLLLCRVFAVVVTRFLSNLAWVGGVFFLLPLVGVVLPFRRCTRLLALLF